MAYQELVKNFNRIRDYMREFYIYGYKSRKAFTNKSSRSYDNERRRVEGWMGDYMQSRRSASGKQIFLTIDSRTISHNPLYQAWKVKSFTDGDMTLHFLLLDILAEKALSFPEILQRLDQALSVFPSPKTFDASTVRKKLKVYAEEGLVTAKKQGNTIVYSAAKPPEGLNEDALNFFSEAAPCGVIGSYLLDQTKSAHEIFALKHHYIASAMDSQVLYELFLALRQKCSVTLELENRKKDGVRVLTVTPLQIRISVQNGRQYLTAYEQQTKRISSFRLDHVRTVKLGKQELQMEEWKAALERMEAHLWGVSSQSHTKERMDYVEFTICYQPQEHYIPKRLLREKRCGTVVQLNETTCKFMAEVYDASELIPWIRTFLCRITQFHCSN